LNESLHSFFHTLTVLVTKLQKGHKNSAPFLNLDVRKKITVQGFRINHLFIYFLSEPLSIVVCCSFKSIIIVV